jgi:acetolactate synthase I/II/III large subunit
MAIKKGGEIIAETLVKEGVDHVFGICGHGTVGLLDCLYDVRDKVRLVSPRHEQTAVHMADGFFRVGHKPAATLTSTGPGSANQIMALAVAQTDSSAIYAMTANVPTSQFNRGPFQELNAHHQADFNNVIKPVVKRSFQPSRVEMLPLAMRQAAQTMTTGRPGPVNLDIPYNLFQEEGEAGDEPAGSAFGLRRSGASAEDVATAVDWLLAAARPVIFIGHGVALSKAEGELTALAHRLRIPVISSPNGMGCIDMSDPLSLGFIGRNGAYQANQAGRHADLVLAIGGRFDDRSASSWKPGYSWNVPLT